jgi:TolB-like protein
LDATLTLYQNKGVHISLVVKASDMPDDGRAMRQAPSRSRKPRKSQPQWPWLRPSIAVAIAPLRNLTSHSEQQFLVDDFTDRLVIGLFRSCRGFTLTWAPGERRWSHLSPPNPSELKYVVSGSVQHGSSHGMLRANIRISETATADYLWACRQEFPPDSIQTEVTAQISRVLHMLVVREASRRASMTSDTELGVTECLVRANAALKREFRADLSAEAQK